jgi:hypothetical protein
MTDPKDRLKRNGFHRKLLGIATVMLNNNERGK